MQDNFITLIKKHRNDNELSQNDLVDILTLNDDFLSKLDVVTLSRWENEKTSPSLEKKVRIMRKLKLLVPYIYSINDFNIKTKIEKSMNIRFGIELNRYKEINSLNNSKKISFDFSNKKHNLGKNITDFLEKQDIGYLSLIDKWPINIGTWYLDNQVQAFFIHLYTNNEIFTYGHYDSWSQLYKKNIDGEINSILLLEQISSTRDFYRLCSLCLFDTLIKNDSLKYVFSYVRTDYFLKLALSLGFEAVATITEPDSVLNEHMDLKFLCVIKIDAIKLLTNKDFLFFCLKCYYDLEKNNPLLLNKIYETSIHAQTLKNTKKAPALGTEQGL
ncbi:helix-turn-helix transcriptional regulator [Photobacterium piscicola]|uniref:helix-turn-helix transcriptional regulator n=1 Tax=Photobacterium piscicola TaxID=1378299 RepID=UPI0038CF75E7